MSAGASRQLQKVTTDDFSPGGLLSPEQFNDFMREVQEQRSVLDRANYISVNAPSGNIPKLSVGSRLLRAVSETGETAKLSVNQPDLSYQTQKVSLPWEMSWESVEETIDNPEQAIREMFQQAFAADLEILASVGDESSADSFESINDGWLTIAASRGSPTYDHATASVNKTLFHEMKQMIPEKYEENANLVYLLSNDQKDAFQNWLTDRSTAAGDQMLLSGNEPTPYGLDLVTPLGWPDDQAMLTSMDNLAWIVQDNMRMKTTQDAERNVMNDIDTIYNLLAKIDYQIPFAQGAVVANNIAAP